MVLVTTEVRFLSSAFEKERGVTGSIAVSKTAGFGSNPGAPAKGFRRVRITVLQQSRKLPGFGP